jgi:simple sugar transport system permease protein
MHYPLGRHIYALGGNEEAARISGVPIQRVKVLVYALCGALSGFAGVVAISRLAAADPTSGVMMELDAIAAVVIGGTLISGGRGYVLGTVVGVLIMGVIQTYISFNGTLNSWWTKIVIGILLLFFIGLQKALTSFRVAYRSATPGTAAGR